MKTTQRATIRASLLASALLFGCGGAASGEGTTANETASEASHVPLTVETGSIEAAIAGPQRSDENRARDPFRHPAETLAFFGLEPGMRVVEMGPGAGWYTEILAPVLRDQGHLVVAIGDPATSTYAQTLVAKLEANPEIYDRVEQVVFVPPARTSLGPDGSADMVLTFRSTHNWINDGHAPAIYEAMFRVLRPGGALGVVQHRADEGADAAETASTGYVPEAAVIALATDAGFVLEERSEINANPNDDHDHPEGVWTLPPRLRLGEVDREQWIAIGESDRMTLRFRKPAGATATTTTLE
jgi:predicted methyltransferase